MTASSNWPQRDFLRIHEALRSLLACTGEDIYSSNLKDTPDRFIKAWDFWTSGYDIKPADILKTFEHSSSTCDTMVFQANIPVWSLCSHHLAPIWGLAHVGYIPTGKVVGLSKLARLVDVYARRLQIQEQLGCQVADSLMEHLGCEGVGVVLQCRHACMESRGVQKSGTISITSALRGSLKDEPECRSEFMSLIQVASQGVRSV